MYADITIKTYVRKFGKDILSEYKPINGKSSADYAIKKAAIEAIVNSYEYGNIDYKEAMKRLVKEI